ncbi:MAG: hypothetical protein K9H25_03385 [Rhodospirillum sp.]|nr:hypothetical protein [Rhodospirillum sp.]MCF8487583.1 hypothetical protein [Rhodospirillum sp.]MCF8500238.1 hypothetical protein [Rhodospirillum sp.]
MALAVQLVSSAPLVVVLGCLATGLPIGLSPSLAQGIGVSVIYVSGTGDIPLMPGLTMVPDSGMVFESSGGRLVEAFARGPFSDREVLSFYGATLPQMGWRSTGVGSYRREGEALDLEFLGEAPNLTVRYSLAPGG